MALGTKKKKKKNEAALPAAEVSAEVTDEEAFSEEDTDEKGKKKKRKKEKEGSKLEISDDIKRLVFIFGGLILILFGYFFGYQTITDQNTLLESQVGRLQAELTTLREMDANKEENVRQIESMKKEIIAITEKYPADVKEEDIMYFIDKLELNETVSGLSTSFSPKQVAGAEKDTASTDASAEESESSGYVLYNTISSLSFTAGYQDTKALVDKILNSDDQMSIGQIDLMFDETTGNLNGTINVNNYSMAGTGKEYQETPIESLPTGRDDLFGTVNVTNNPAGPAADEVAETTGE